MLEAADQLDARAAGLTEKALQVAELRRQGLTYTASAERLSISMSTAHYRQSRYEQAGDPIPLLRVWVRLLCAAGLPIDEACRVRRRDGHVDPSTSLRIYTESLRDRERVHHGKAFDDLLNGDHGQATEPTKTRPTS